VDISPLLTPDCQVVEFESIWQGNWELIPEEVSSRFANLDVAVKFGMNLLRNPDSVPTRLGMLSYHHGDPTKYRGRPAVFHEMANGEKFVGAIVQRLNNTLDGGVVFAQCRIPITNYSYRKTLYNTYLGSISLLHKAICASQLDSDASPSSSLGTLRTLPKNWQVSRLILKVQWRGFMRLLYGLFVEKIWQLGQLPQFVDLCAVQVIEVSDLMIIHAPQGYSFIADPFVLGKDIYCEGMNARTGVGQILRYDGEWRAIDLHLDGQHASYPQTVGNGSRTYLFPEVGGHTAPKLYELAPDGKSIISKLALLGLGDLRLADATLFQQHGLWYLFGTQVATADYQLELWVAKEINGPYQQHPSSPIRIDPEGSRMAGPLDYVDGSLIRFGQVCTSRYGDGIKIFRVTKLTPTEYQEVSLGAMEMSGAFGPHTISREASGLILDFYQERISLMAGTRRLRSYLQSRKLHGTGNRNFYSA